MDYDHPARAKMLERVPDVAGDLLFLVESVNEDQVKHLGTVAEEVIRRDPMRDCGKWREEGSTATFPWAINLLNIPATSPTPISR